MLTAFCWSYVDVILSGGQVKLPAEQRGSGQPCVRDGVGPALCVLVLSIEPLVAVWQGSQKVGGGGGAKGRFSFFLNRESRPAEEREMDLLQMPPWAH